MDYSDKKNTSRLSIHDNFSLNLSAFPRFFPSLMRLNSIGYQYINYQSAGLRHETIDVGVVLSSESGKYIYSVDGTAAEYVPPLILIKGPGNVYGNLTDSMREVLYFAYPAKLLSVFKDLGLAPGMPAMEISTASVIMSLALEIIRYLDLIHQHGEIDRIERLCEMLLLEASILKKHSTLPASTEYKKIEEIALFINTNYKKKINMAELIGRYGFSKRSFYREWKKKYSVTPYDYLESLRMSRASSLICNSRMRIGEIASSLNYDDSLYFSRRFKETFHMSPREYRKKFGMI